MRANFVIGIDLGGTKVAAAAFAMDGARLGKVAKLPTMARMRRAVTLMNIRRVVKQAKIEAGVEGAPNVVGMGSSGPLDLKNQIICDEDSLPNLAGFDMGAFCRREIGAPLALENDAACFTLGEAVRGAGLGHDSVLGVTLGTGFGCGIVIQGKVYSGATNNAGEVAYCRVGPLTYDEVGSGERVKELYKSSLGGGTHAPTAREIGDLAEGGDRDAIGAWQAYGKGVGTAIGAVCSVLDPSVVVIGGSVAKRLDLFGSPLAASARQVLLGAAAERFEVRPSALGDAAGVTGAAALALM